MRIIKWGIISTAKIGMKHVNPAIQKADNSMLYAIASRNKEQAERAAQELEIPVHYGSYEELLEDPEIDAVYNPLPNHLHVPITKKALKAGKHVLCEKPIGLNAKEALELQKFACNFPDLKVMEAFMYRFHPQWRLVKTMLDRGDIGEVLTIHTFFSYFNTDPQNIRNQHEIGGGALMDIGCYCISFPRFLFASEPKQVMAMVDRDKKMKVDYLTSGLLKFENNKSSTFTCSTQLSPYQKTNIYGTNGRLEVDIPVNAPANEKIKITLDKAGRSQTFFLAPADQYQLQVYLFAEAILKNKPVPTSLEDAIANMKVIDAMLESEKSGRWIDL